jgi:PPM family protein phosphatase
MGGHNAGVVASRLAVEKIVSFLHDQTLTLQNRGKLLREAVRHANRAIFEMANQKDNLHGMGTTIVVAEVKGNSVHIAHVGDSRAYVVHENDLMQLTEDDSIVWQLMKKGMISKEEVRTHPYRHLLIRSIGVHEDVEVTTTEVRAGRRDLILLCTDGLTDMLTDDEIKVIIQSQVSLEDKCRCLVQSANDSGGVDNITIVLFSPTCCLHRDQPIRNGRKNHHA